MKITAAVMRFLAMVLVKTSQKTISSFHTLNAKYFRLLILNKIFLHKKISDLISKNSSKCRAFIYRASF